MIGLFVLLPALFTTGPRAHASSSIYATCTGAGWSIDVGVQPGAAGTDLVQLTADDGKGAINGFEASIPTRNVKRALAAGLAFNNTSKAGDHATFKLKGKAGTWTYADAAHAVSCELN